MNAILFYNIIFNFFFMNKIIVLSFSQKKKKIVLSSLPSYCMQVNWFPQSVCDDLDKTIRRFISKGAVDKGMRLVGWNKFT